MSLTDDERAHILNEHLRNIHDISDKEYQRRVWIRTEGPEVDDYDETVEYFNDASEWILDEPEAYGLNGSQIEILSSFRAAFNQFDNIQYWADERDFIDTPEWDRIVKMAGEVLKAFNYQQPSSPEV